MSAESDELTCMSSASREPSDAHAKAVEAQPIPSAPIALVDGSTPPRESSQCTDTGSQTASSHEMTCSADLKLQLLQLGYGWLADAAKDWLRCEGSGPSAFRCAHDLIDLLEHVEGEDD